MRHSVGVLLSLGVVLAWAGTGWGQVEKYYVGPHGGNYNVDGNWAYYEGENGTLVPDPNVPGTNDPNDYAYISNGATVILNSSVPEVARLAVGRGTVTANNSTLHILPGASVNVTGGTASQFTVGNNSSAGVVQSGGNVTADYFSMGGTLGEKATYTLSDGVLQTLVQYVNTTMDFGRAGGTAKFEQTGGYLDLFVPRFMNVGYGNGTGAEGTFIMKNGIIDAVNTTLNPTLNIGRQDGGFHDVPLSYGYFQLLGGAVLTYRLWIGRLANSYGVMDIEGGLVRVLETQSFYVGAGEHPTATGVVNVKGGLLAPAGEVFIARRAATGVMNVSGGWVLFAGGVGGTSKRPTIGHEGGRGTLNVSGGQVTSVFDLVLAQNVYTWTDPNLVPHIFIPQGVLTVSGSGVVTATKVFGGRHGPAKIEVSGGSLATSSLIRVGGGLDGDTTDPNCVGQMTVSGGSVNVGGNLSVGYKHGTGTVTLSNGVFQVGGRTDIGDVINAGLWPTGSGTFIMTGGRFESGFGPLGTGMDPVRVGVNSSSFMGAVAKGALIITGGTFRAPEIRLLNDCDPLSPDSAKLKIGANADVELSNQFRIYKTGSAVEMEIVSATKNSLLKSLGTVDLGTNMATLAVNSTGYRPREGDKFALMTAPTTMTGSFSSISSNITLGLPGGVAFTGGIVTDPNTSALSYVVTFQGLTAGDADGNHRVDGGDLALMGGGWMKTGQTWGTGDFDGNGKVDGSDLALMGGNWMWTKPGPAPEAALPEPATVALLALGGLAMIRRRR